MLSLLSIEHADDNLTYRFSDALGNILVISNAQKTILDPAGMDVLCTYLDLNQFVHTITLSSTGTLPVQITTLQDIAHAQRIFQIVNLSFCSLYFVIPTVLFLFLRRKIRKTNK